MMLHSLDSFVLQNVYYSVCFDFTLIVYTKYEQHAKFVGRNTAMKSEYIMIMLHLVFASYRIDFSTLSPVDR